MILSVVNVQRDVITVLQKTAEGGNGSLYRRGWGVWSVPWMTSHLKEVQTLRWTRRLPAAVMVEIMVEPEQAESHGWLVVNGCAVMAEAAATHMGEGSVFCVQVHLCM